MVENNNNNTTTTIPPFLFHCSRFPQPPSLFFPLFPLLLYSFLVSPPPFLFILFPPPLDYYSLFSSHTLLFPLFSPPISVFFPLSTSSFLALLCTLFPPLSSLFCSFHPFPLIHFSVPSTRGSWSVYLSSPLLPSPSLCLSTRQPCSPLYPLH